MKPFQIPPPAPPWPAQAIPHCSSPSLWQALTPDRQQQVAQAWAEMVQRMRRQPPPAPTVNDHEHI